MAPAPSIRQFVVLKATKYLVTHYESKNLKVFAEDFFTALGDSSLACRITVESTPSLDWKLDVVGEHPEPPAPDELIVSFQVADMATLRVFRNLAHHFVGKPLRSVHGETYTIVAIGADPGGGLADHWCPGAAQLGVFGRRGDARRLLSVDALTSSGLGGAKVNVVIIDQGLDSVRIAAKNWGGGLAYVPGGIAPGTAPRTSHGMMIARNILDIAPDAILYDVPLIPDRITDVSGFASKAAAVYGALLVFIAFLRAFPRWSGPWILVNAWAIFDRTSELPLGSYTQNLEKPFGHWLNIEVGAAVNLLGLDVVFAAGNCGEFCPDQRCGPVDRGPGHSIWGANSHAAVMTAGAVLTDETWLGMSSQGPGQPLLADQKPDFCAPSAFRETIDASVTNTGTSAACALTAGVTAALRSNPAWTQAAVPPGVFKDILIQTTRQPQGPGWNRRLGNGILNVANALAMLQAKFP